MITKSNSYLAVKIFFILMIQSCVSENKEIIRDDKGNIVLKCELKNGVRHGKCFEYYSDGTIKATSTWVSGVQNGESMEYFENGKVKSTGMWKDNKMDGEIVWYYENGGIRSKMYFIKGQGHGHELYDEAGNLKEIRGYVYINGEPWLNRWAFFDTDSACIYPRNVIFEKSRWAQIDADRDTIDYGGFAEYELSWVSDEPVIAYTGNIDHNFNVIDSTSLKTVDLDNKNRFYPSHLKTDTLRIIFKFVRREDGEFIIIHQSNLEEVFTVLDK